jgi:hypothetical protein
MFVRRVVRVSLLPLLPLLLVGCPPTVPKQAIVGTWQTGINEKKSTQTFWDNGVWTFEAGKRKQTGTYKFVSDKEIEITLDRQSDGKAADAKPTVYKRNISFAHHDQMSTTDMDTGQRKVWKRVEQP